MREAWLAEAKTADTAPTFLAERQWKRNAPLRLIFPGSDSYIQA
jgi:hypothetical protein